MKNIQRLLAALADETGIIAQLEVKPFSSGWTARIVEDGEVLLDSAGERFLVAYDEDDLYSAIQELDAIVAQGYKLAKEWA